MSCKFFFHFQLFIFYFLQNVQSLFHLPLSFKPNTSPWPPVVTAGTAGNADIFVYILYIYMYVFPAWRWEISRTSFPPVPGWESTQTNLVVLENVPDHMNEDMLLMLVEYVSGSKEDSFSLEMIRDSGRAVVVFNQPQGKRVQS